MSCFARFILIVMMFMMTSAESYADVPVSKSNIIIFASFSMPPRSVKGWMQEGSKAQTPVIIRGLINNSFKATIEKMAELAADNQGGVQLDPTLFQRYQITQVPAVVVTNNDDFDVIYGDVKLSYALQKIADQNDSVSPIAKNALEKLRGNHEI
jgi:type-F conjugative transfer system pilin assembly protein TrbC